MSCFISHIISSLSATTDQLTFEDPPPSVSSIDILELLWMSLRLRPIFLRPRGAMARANRSELRLLSCSLSSNISAATTVVDSLSLMDAGVFGVETHVELRSWRGKPLNRWKHKHLKSTLNQCQSLHCNTVHRQPPATLYIDRHLQH